MKSRANSFRIRGNTYSTAVTSCGDKELQAGGGLQSPIKVEANLLRFPIFALHTKGLGELDGIECVGTRVLDGKSHEFRLSVTRNVVDPYPGPLSRKVHFALLSVVSENGLPFENPVKFSWRKLARRMGICYSGTKGIGELKSAIRSTSGIEIRSQFALKAGAVASVARARARDVKLDGTGSYRTFEAVNERSFRTANNSRGAGKKSPTPLFSVITSPPCVQPISGISPRSTPREIGRPNRETGRFLAVTDKAPPPCRKKS